MIVVRLGFMLNYGRIATVADAFMELMVCRYGAPEEFLTDNGTHFDNKMIKDISNILQTKKIFTSVYHPEANGQSERLNATICNNTKYLPYILYMYRSTYHKAINTTPFQMIYGRKPILPTETQLMSFKDEDLDTYAKNLKSALKQIHDDARKVMKEAYDEHYSQPQPRTVKEFKEGDLVLVQVHKPHKFRA